jgi:PadR family transcriptional regulator PadR
MTDDHQLKKGSMKTLILAVLASGPLHGYAIAREIERRSADALKMGEGALYPALRAMEGEGLLTASWEIQANGPARKIYVLTEDGRAALEKQMQAWRAFTDAVNSVIGGTPHAQPA